MTGWEEPALGAAAAFIEALFGLGTIVPGEVAVTALAARVDAAERAWLVVAVTLGATTGDHVNYWLGRVLGQRLAESRAVARIGTVRWDEAVALVHRYGTWAVVASRLLPLVRTLTAGVAGVAAMPHRRFTAASLAGSALWATAWVAAGGAVRGVLGDPLWLALAVPAACLVVLLTRWAARRLSSGAVI